MAMDEAMRHRVHGKLEQLLDSDEAAAVMSVLPTVDVATKADIRALEERFDQRFAQIDQRFEYFQRWLDERFGRFETTLELAVAQARAETSREVRLALRASFGVIAAAASAVLSAIGFFG